MSDRDIYTEQIIIAPRYHNQLLDEAKESGRSLTGIMAQRVEQFPQLLKDKEDLTQMLEFVLPALEREAGRVFGASAALKSAQALLARLQTKDTDQ